MPSAPEKSKYVVIGQKMWEAYLEMADQHPPTALHYVRRAIELGRPLVVQENAERARRLQERESATATPRALSAKPRDRKAS